MHVLPSVRTRRLASGSARAAAASAALVYALELALVGFAYYQGSRISLGLGMIEEGLITSIWIPSAISLAAILFMGYRVVPALLVADVAVSFSLGIPPVTAVGLALATILEPLLALLLLRGDREFRPALDRVRVVLRLVAVAFIAPLAGATPGIVILVGSGIVAPDAAFALWRSWWLADAMALLVLAPLLLVWSRPLALRLDRLPEAVALGIGLALSASVVFMGLLAPFAPIYPHSYLIFPFLVWAGLRFEARGATAAAFLAAAIAIAGTLLGLGPFARGPPGENLLFLQLFIGTHTATALLLAAAVSERARAREEVRVHRDHLQDLVDARTRELAKANEGLHARVAELAEANEELEAFSYSASHDLRAPLRGIDTLSEALLEDEADRLSPEGSRILERLREQSRRMTRLVDDLLSLSRVARADLNCENVDVSALAASVADELARRSPGRTVELMLQPGMVAYADAGLLRIVLENVLGNAWKYTRTRPVARVEMTGTPSPEGTIFAVRDNGVGFDPAAAPRLFKPFQRLHAGSEFEGTGIGLATVRRIVERHGGRVWAEGRPGEGATISFTLEPGSAREAAAPRPSRPAAP